MDYNFYLEPSSLRYNMFVMGYMPHRPQTRKDHPDSHPNYFATWPKNSTWMPNTTWPPRAALAYIGKPKSYLGNELLNSSTEAMSETSVRNENSGVRSDLSSSEFEEATYTSNSEKRVTLCIPRQKDGDQTWENFLKHEYVKLPPKRFTNRSQLKCPFCLRLDTVLDIVVPESAVSIFINFVFGRTVPA